LSNAEEGGFAISAQNVVVAQVAHIYDSLTGPSLTMVALPGATCNGPHWKDSWRMALAGQFAANGNNHFVYHLLNPRHRQRRRTGFRG
jgi:hypothetical protein